MMFNIIRKVREMYWKSRLKYCGKNFLCCSGVKIKNAHNMTVGDNVRIGEGSFLNASGGINIGSNVQTGPQIYIWTSNHNYDEPEKLPFDDTLIFKETNIGDNVWIGAKSSIIPGVTIGEGAVIGMCSVVVKDVPPCAVVGGNPAKILKYRNIEYYNKLKEKSN